MSYQKLQIYNIAFDLFIETHGQSLKLPKYELYELGSQIRRSSDSVVTNITEGYGRRAYKKDYTKFLIYSHSSNDETIGHLLKIKMLYPEFAENCESLIERYNKLGGKINNYTQYVIKNWNNNQSNFRIPRE